MPTDVTQLAQRIKDQIDNKYENQSEKRKKWKWTLEMGRGQTYAHAEPVLYAHSTYGRGSVMAGRAQRVYIEKFDSWDEARKALAEVAKAVPKFKFDDMGPNETDGGGGSTHIDINMQTAGIPDTPDL